MIDPSKLRLLIRGKFLTDKSFAKALNLSNVELSKYLNGKKKIECMDNIKCLKKTSD